MTDADKEWGWGGSVQARRLIKSKSFREIAQRRVELVSRDFHGGAGLTEHERQEEEILSDLMGALLQATMQRSLELAAQQAAVNLSLQSQAVSIEGFGEVIDVYA